MNDAEFAAFLERNSYPFGRLVEGVACAVGPQTFGKWRLYVDCDTWGFKDSY